MYLRWDHCREHIIVAVQIHFLRVVRMEDFFFRGSIRGGVRGGGGSRTIKLVPSRISRADLPLGIPKCRHIMGPV